MNLYWRFLNLNDYELLSEWGEFWRFPLPPVDFLPQSDGLFNGFMICDDEGLELCAGFVYETNSKVCWMEYIISNPNMRNKDLRTKSISLLIHFLCESSKQKGYKYMFTTVKNKNLINRYSDNGFSIGTKGTTEMIKIL